MFMHAAAGHCKCVNYSVGTALRIWINLDVERKRFVHSILYADRWGRGSYLLLRAWLDSFKCTLSGAQSNLSERRIENICKNHGKIIQ